MINAAASSTKVQPRAFSFTGRLRSFTHAFRGLGLMLATQHNAWIHAAATIGVVVAGFAARLERSEWCWIVLAIVGVWMAEALNTAFELLCDVASPEFHPMVKQAKDVAASAVLVAAMGSAVIGILIFSSHFRSL
jgi:diacylglycerol kinase (ATP)